MNTPRPRWTPQTKTIVIVMILVLTAYFLMQFKEAITPVILSLILAYILTPLVDRLQTKARIPRALGIVLIYLALLLLFSLLIRLLAPQIISEFGGLGERFNEWFLALEKLFGQRIRIGGYEINGQDLLERGIDSLQGLLEPAVGRTFGVVSSVLSSALWVIFIVIIAFYLIKDSSKLARWLDELAPPPYREDFRILRKKLDNIWSSFFRGQLLLSLIVMAILTAEGFIIGLRFALVMGVIGGLLEFMPSIGHAIWISLATLVALLGGSAWIPIPNWAFALLVVGIHIIFTQFDLNYLIPRIIGRSVNLPPVVVILGIVAGASFAGVIGVVLAAPTIASLRVIGSYVYAYLFDTDPFPGSAPRPLPPPDPRWWQKRKSAVDPRD